MSDDATQLRELLAYHGSDVNKWPEEARPWGFAACERPDLAAIFEEEKRFERRLMARQVPTSSRDLAQRIIAASFTQAHTQRYGEWVSELLAEVRPAALAAMLVIGFAIGFGMLAPAHNPQAASTQSFSDDEGAIL